MLFQRYASPFDLLNITILTQGLSDFVFDLVKTVNKERSDKADWEFFLHKVYDCSFAEFKERMQTDKENREMSKEKMGATIAHSLDILNNFNPEEDGGGDL